MLSTPPAFILSQDQTLYKMVSKEPKFFKSFIESFIMTSFVLRLPFRVIDSTAYSGDFWFQFRRTVSVWCFLFVTLFNLQGAHPASAEHCYSNTAFFICQPLFSIFFKILFCGFHPNASRQTALTEYQRDSGKSTRFFALCLLFSTHFPFSRFFLFFRLLS